MRCTCSNVVRISTALLVSVALYTAAVVPSIVIYPSNRVVDSSYCGGGPFECNGVCYFDLEDPFCVIVSNNCSYAVRNSTHVQIGSLIYTDRVSIVSTTTDIVNGTSVLDSKHLC